jgi:hypothetical protein
MQIRADAILSYSKGKITVTMPQTIDEHWKRDGLNKDDVTTSATLQRIVALVPPSHWEQRFATTPEKLVGAIKAKEDVPILVESWSKAALLHHTMSWISPLVDMWQHLHKKSKSDTDLELTIQMLTRLPPQEAEPIITHLLFEHIHWNAALMVRPRPWSHNFGEACLQALQDYVRTLKKNEAGYYEWKQIMDAAAIALPESCFERARQPWEMPEEEKHGWVISYWRRNVTEFSEVLRIRKQIMEEIQ